ncbi:helix-turn-helix domain-containing protein [Chryseobacterium sp.]|uniref:helix-turn-helix domain-containing protein n=1 Tax=Chryseobacterium sp. TaxID=1871047 RepID=UPI0028A20CF9|nr:helix-turn-helix domain-containing protein [Chryseobacterium sp.]
MHNFKEISIGQLIEMKVTESGISMSRICNFFKCPESEICKMYKNKSLDTDILLKWSKILEYDFFRIYSQHLILYAPISAANKEIKNTKKSSLPKFRKNIYTKEIIDFILEQISSGEMTKMQVMNRYKIPKTTLYKWISKYQNSGLGETHQDSEKS